MHTTLLTVTVISALIWGSPTLADEGTENRNLQGSVVGTPHHGPNPHPHPHPHPRPGPNPHPGPGYLCQGQFWGGFSNGVQAMLNLTPAGWNRVNVAIHMNGGYVFAGEGTCDDWGAGRAHIDFYVQGPGTGWAHGWGDIWQNGPGAVVQGGINNGLNFSFSR